MTSDSNNAPLGASTDIAAPVAPEAASETPASETLQESAAEPRPTSAAAELVREVVIEKWVYGGAGLGRVEGKVVLVPFTLPGERVRVEAVTNHGGYDEARVIEILERSSERIEPGCPLFERCGGCQYQHATAEYQVARKVELLREVFRRVGKFEAPERIDVLTGEAWGYRNRTQFHLEGREIGFLAAGTHTLVPVEECPVSAPAINIALKTLRYMARDRGWPVFLRTLELFTNGRETLVNVLETEGSRGVAKGFFEWVGKHIEGGALGALEYKAAGATFRVSHGAFFQVNRHLVDALTAHAVAGVAGNSALDLYAGVGLFTLPLAHSFGTVAAVESSKQAARDLEFNAQRAGVKVAMHALQAEQYLQTLQTAPDFVLADPPRSGLGKGVVKHLLRLQPERIRVVSCDPATLARDAAGLIAGGYGLAEVTLADLFPQTSHVETIVTFVKR